MEDLINIKIIDYGMGNIQSVKNAFELLNNKVEIINDPSSIRNADGIILPGVGAFGNAIKNLIDKYFNLLVSLFFILLIGSIFIIKIL